MFRERFLEVFRCIYAPECFQAERLPSMPFFPTDSLLTCLDFHQTDDRILLQKSFLDQVVERCRDMRRTIAGGLLALAIAQQKVGPYRRQGARYVIHACHFADDPATCPTHKTADTKAPENRGLSSFGWGTRIRLVRSHSPRIKDLPNSPTCEV